MSEAAVLKRTMLQASKVGARLLRNSRGAFYTIDGVKALIKAIQANNLAKAREVITRLRIVRAGLEAPGSSDTAGMYTMLITPEMVGLKIGVALVVEVKEEEWKRPTDAHEREQENFIDQVNKRGGIGFFLNNHEDLQKKIDERLKIWIDAGKKIV